MLLAAGAKVDALNHAKLTPLEAALEQMSNADLEDALLVAEALLKAGAKTTPRCKAAVQEAAKTFEFHRAGFDKKSVAKTAAACAKLCRMFGVESPEPRQMHDGKSEIVTKAKSLQGRLDELSGLLVPSSGPAATVQGEVIRIAMLIHDEIHRNGGVNWDAEYTKMLHSWAQHVSSAVGKRVSEAEAQEMLKISVEWVRKNPVPVKLKKPAYKR